MDPLTIGAIMGGVGLVGKLFNKGPGEFKAPQLKKFGYNDINLQTDVPELYDEMMRNDKLISRIQNILNVRRQGPSPQEMDMLNSNSARMAEEQNAAGLLGTTAGMASAGNARARMEDSLRDRAFREEMGLYGELANQQNQAAQFHRGVMGDVYNAGNNQAMAENARAMAEAEANYNRRAQNSAAINGIFGGIANAGFSMMGTGMANNAIANRPSFGGNYAAPPNYGFNLGGGSYV